MVQSFFDTGKGRCSEKLGNLPRATQLSEWVPVSARPVGTPPTPSPFPKLLEMYSVTLEL